MKQILIERLSPAESNLSIARDDKHVFLSGRMMAAEQRNLNQRTYPKQEIEKAVNEINKRISEGTYVMGELNHPDNLSIDLKNVSHIITEAWMDGNNAVGKCKILDTPSGQIVKNLIDGGVKLGVSSRGTGNLTNEGIVQDYMFVTVDIVATPSGPGCYPDVVRESVENPKILSLAEAVINDEKAQKYLKEEIQKFLSNLLK